MTIFARVIDSTVIDVSLDPEQEFHPDLAAQFVSVPTHVQHGWKYINSEWVAPEESPPNPIVIYPKVSPVEFKLLFTPQERVAISLARAENPVIEDFFKIVDDPRLTTVDLGLSSTQQGLDYLCSLGLLSTQRKDAILQGVLQ